MLDFFSLSNSLQAFRPVNLQPDSLYAAAGSCILGRLARWYAFRRPYVDLVLKYGRLQLPY